MNDALESPPSVEAVKYRGKQKKNPLLGLRLQGQFFISIRFYMAQTIENFDKNKTLVE